MGFLVETIKAMIVVKTHFKNYSCNEFYNILLIDNELLNAIIVQHKSTQKQQKKKSTNRHNQNKMVSVSKYFICV